MFHKSRPRNEPREEIYRVAPRSGHRVRGRPNGSTTSGAQTSGTGVRGQVSTYLNGLPEVRREVNRGECRVEARQVLQDCENTQGTRDGPVRQGALHVT